MSGFYSDFITYMTVAMVGGAALATAMPERQPDNSLVASANTDITMIRDIAASKGIDITAPNVDEVPLATLVPVTFNVDGTEAANRLVPIPEAVPTGVVDADAVNLRAGPGTGNRIVGRGTRGQTFEVTGETKGPWIEIAGGTLSGTAWVHGNYFSILN